MKYQCYTIYIFIKKLRLIYDQFGNHLFNNYCCNIILNNLHGLNEYIGEEDYEIIINMYMNIYEFEKERKNQKKRYNKRYYDYIKIFVYGCDK